MIIIFLYLYKEIEYEIAMKKNKVEFSRETFHLEKFQIENNLIGF